MQGVYIEIGNPQPNGVEFHVSLTISVQLAIGCRGIWIPHDTTEPPAIAKQQHRFDSVLVLLTEELTEEQGCCSEAAKQLA